MDLTTNVNLQKTVEHNEAGRKSWMMNSRTKNRLWPISV